MGTMETLLAVILTLAGVLLLSPRRIRRWFPGLTQAKVAIVISSVYVALGIGVTVLFLTETSLCESAKTGVLIQDSTLPFINKLQAGETAETALLSRCQSYIAECSIDDGETTSQVDAICAPYR